MADGIEIGDPRNDADFERFIEVDAEAFGSTLETSARWMAEAKKHVRLRLARADGEIVGGYAVMQAGQFYGGRSVPAACVAAVAVRPLWRRQGLAGRLMRDCVAVCRDDGAALAPLYAATVSLYRRWGWEVGSRSVHQRVRTAALTSLRGEGRAVEVGDDAEVEALRRSYLPHWDGPLDRPDWWLAVEGITSPGTRQYRHGWREGDRLTGYVRYRHEKEAQVLVDEFHATTPDALRGLLGVLGGMASLADEVEFHSCLPPDSDLLYMLADAAKTVRSEASLCWMQRIVDIDAAVAARGWRAGVTGLLELEVNDPVRDQGPRRVVFEFDGGGARASEGGSGAVRCGAGALGAWYAGALTAWDARRIGLLHAGDGDVELMDGAIERRPLWMADHF